MSTEAFVPVDPDTGEVLEPDDAAALADELAAAYVHDTERLEELGAEVDTIAKRRDTTAHRLRAVLDERDGRADGGSAWVVLNPPKRPQQRVIRQACEAYSEQLLDLGLGAMETRYRAPTMSEVREARGQIVARLGAKALDTIAPEPTPPPAVIEVVPK